MDGREFRELAGDLQVLVELSRTGTVTAAADAVGMPQPSASRALARLSARVGTPLTVRNGRVLALTDAGRQLAQSGAEALASVEDGLTAARRSAGARKTLVTVAYQTALGETFLPRAIARYRGRHPGVRFRLVHGARARCVELVRDDEVDIAVTADPPHEAGLSTTPLFTETLYVVTARHHPLTMLDRPVRPADLLDHDLIILGRGFGMHDSIRRILGTTQTPAHVFEVDDHRIARGLAAAGAGITILPPALPNLEDDTAELPIDHPAAHRTVGALTATDPDPTTETVLDALRVTARYQWRGASVGARPRG